MTIHKMQNIFNAILKGKTVIVGIGNTMKGDDGAGPLIAENLKSKITAVCINADNSFERYAGKIVKENPDTVLFIDAAHLGLEPGKYAILKKEELVNAGFTTHDIPAGMFMEYLEDRTRARIYMLGIQPENISLGNPVSDRVKSAIDEITKLLEEHFNA